MVTDRELDTIVDRVDEMLRKGQFEEYDIELRELNVKQLTSDEIITHLTLSGRARSKLPYHFDFYAKAEKTLKERGDYSEGLLDGLK